MISASTEAILRDLREKGWKESHIFARIDFLEPDAFPSIVEIALSMLYQNRGDTAAEELIAYTNLQFPSALHPHLTTIFELCPNCESYFADWPWRESGKQHFQFLYDVLTDKHQFMPTRIKAWRAMLETRDMDVLASAVASADLIKLEYDVNTYLAEVGYEVQDGRFRQLYPDAVYHICFDHSYITDGTQSWLHFDHPTWNLSTSDSMQMPFGGTCEGSCKVCGHELHHFITLDPIPDGIPVTGVSRLVLATCLTCLIWEVPALFYKHNGTGKPDQTGYGDPIITPQFPAIPFRPTQVRLVETPNRWRWQLANSHENLHRLGGHPSWIQSAIYLTCPECRQRMTFILQLNSGLDQGWLWGTGGICYVLWCDHCKISGYTLQDT